MKSIKTLIFLAGLFTSTILLVQCNKEPAQQTPSMQIEIPSEQLSFIEASTQRSGDQTAGRNYLLGGDYVDSGIPLDLFRQVYGNSENDLNREGLNDGIEYSFNAFESSNGVEIASPNCFQCHASTINGELIIGLGNIDADFTVDQSATNTLLNQIVISTYGQNSPEWEAYHPFSQAIEATSSQLKTETVGSNPADKLAALLASHRDPESLEWIEEGQLDVPDGVVPTDVPPWWNLKKKNSMFYTSVGRGDFARISMASSILTIKDTIKAKEVDNKFADVIAFINSIEAPAYPFPYNEELAEKGEELFLSNCSSCHGTYGTTESYPNLLVDLDLIKTDSMLIYANFGFENFTEWYNDSWFGKGPNAAQLVRERGYIAPPLDGIWASAPYLHNGSVPDIRSLLDSKSRPDIWRKIGDNSNYNEQNLGWFYESLDTKIDKYSYDTSIPGYSNTGHEFGDHLNQDDRDAILEYLKTI